MPFDADDLDCFNDPDMPGAVVATIGGVAIAGRFRKAYAEVLMAAGNKPTFVAAIADLAGVDEDDVASIDGASYTVAEIISPDPQMPHMTRLLLEAS
jgi:hypothetical protein